MVAQILSARAGVRVASITKANFKIDKIVMSAPLPRAVKLSCGLLFLNFSPGARLPNIENPGARRIDVASADLG
jgi:hypothetical protein